jgi:protein-S-isoprenylcysteine O-methyltransferase Ste14
MKNKAPIVLATVLTVTTVGQIILSFVLYNRDGSQLLRNAGWAVLCISALFGWLPIYAFRRKGGVPKGKSYVHTTVLVDSGIYAIVRHPQYLAGIMLSLALALIAQHWLVAALGLVAAVTHYVDTFYEEKSCIEKFGDAYGRYMESVPKMNFLTGLFRLIRRRAGQQELG